MPVVVQFVILRVGTERIGKVRLETGVLPGFAVLLLACYEFSLLSYAQQARTPQQSSSFNTMADVDVESGSSTKGGGSKKKFEVKKWNAVALWAWGTYTIFRALCLISLTSCLQILWLIIVLFAEITLWTYVCIVFCFSYYFIYFLRVQFVF
jgi:hypothetical protein